MPQIQFAVQAYKARALPVAAQEVVNLFAEANPPDAKSPVTLLGSPGIKPFSIPGSGPIRGLHTFNGDLYAVSGGELYLIASDGSSTLIGAIAGTGRVDMEDNGDGGSQMIVVNGVEGYIWDGTTLTEITDEDFRQSEVVAFQDGYFLLIEKGTNNWFVSNLNNGLAYLGTDLATAEGASDRLVGLISNHREVWLFGEKTTEIWVNTGATGFPFERIPGFFAERGCGAARSIERIDNTIMWLGEDRIVYRAEGYTPTRVSQHAIEQAIEGYSVISDAFAIVHTLAGHKFYCLTFPTEGVTWCYDVATQLWHERRSAGTRWLANAFAEAYGKTFVGHFDSNQVGEIDWDTFTEFGETMIGIATSPTIHEDRKRIFHRRFELDIESGVGLTTGQGSDPKVVLDWSNDGGRTFSQRKLPRSMGKKGEHLKRLRWRRLGKARNRIYRITISDPVKRSIVAAHAELAAGTS